MTDLSENIFFSIENDGISVDSFHPLPFKILFDIFAFYNFCFSLLFFIRHFCCRHYYFHFLYSMLHTMKWSIISLYYFLNKDHFPIQKTIYKIKKNCCSDKKNQTFIIQLNHCPRQQTV